MQLELRCTFKMDIETAVDDLWFAPSRKNLLQLPLPRALLANEIITLEARWDATHVKVAIFIHPGGDPSATPVRISETAPMKRNGEGVVGGGGGGGSGSDRLTIGDRVMLAKPCSKSGLAMGEIGVIVKDDHDSRPYKVQCKGGVVSDYYTVEELRRASTRVVLRLGDGLVLFDFEKSSQTAVFGASLKVIHIDSAEGETFRRSVMAAKEDKEALMARLVAAIDFRESCFAEARQLREEGAAAAVPVKKKTTPQKKVTAVAAAARSSADRRDAAEHPAEALRRRDAAWSEVKSASRRRGRRK